MNLPVISLMTLLIVSSYSSAETAEISITLPEYQTSQYEKPYTAIWIADKQNKPVRVINLWSENDRWLKELKHFWRRVLRNKPEMIDGISGATKGPGRYRITWDGLDFDGQPLNKSEYRLCAEVAREHGGHKAKCLNFQYPLMKNQTHIVEPKGELIRLTIMRSQ